MRQTDDGMNGLHLYLAEIGREPLLSKQEEEQLARAMEEGRRAAASLSRAGELPPEEREALEEAVAAGDRARQRFIRANLRLVVSVARQWARGGLALLDLVQEGNLGLMRAVEGFDYRRGFRFSTYATWWIRQSISRAVANGGRLVRLPVHTGEALTRVLREQRLFEEDHGRSASVGSLAAAVDMTPERVSNLLRLAPEPVSISEPLGVEGDELGSVVADKTGMSPSERALASLVRAEIDRLLDVLDSREREVLALRFGLAGDEPWSFDAIGRRLGLSREAVRQSQARALRTLRRLALASPETRELLAV